METKENLVKAANIKGSIRGKHERIKQLQQLAKLKTNKPLISEFDRIINTVEKINQVLLESKDVPDAQKEQVKLKSNARIALILKGIKNNIISSQISIDRLNEEIAKDNEEIRKLTNKPKEGKHAQII